MEYLDVEDIIIEAQAAYEAGDYLKAANSYLRAVGGFSKKGDEFSAAEIANNCCVAYLMAGEPSLALEVIEGKEAIFLQLDDKHRLAMTLGNRGAAFDALKRLDEALVEYQRAAELFNAINQQELYASTMQVISSLQLRKGQSLEAVATMRVGINKIQRPNLKQRLLKKLLDIPFQMLNRKG